MYHITFMRTSLNLCVFPFPIGRRVTVAIELSRPNILPFTVYPIVNVIFVRDIDKKSIQFCDEQVFYRQRF